MPQSRKRPGHAYQKPADIPAAQRTTGHLIWALLVSVFGLLIAFFAAGTNIFALIIGAVSGAALGWFLGKKMERDAKAR